MILNNLKPRDKFMEEKILLAWPTEEIGRALLVEMSKYPFYVLALSHPDDRPAIESLRLKILRGECHPEFKLEILWGNPAVPCAGLDTRTLDKLSNTLKIVINCPALSVRDRHNYYTTLESISKSTEQLIALAHRLANLKVFAHISTAFISGNYAGRFYEDWLDVGQGFYDPLHRTHFIGEAKIQNAGRSIPTIIFRCGLLVGSGDTGEFEEKEGLYNFFHFLKNFDSSIPKAIPVFIPDSEDRFVSLTPTDYAAKAIVWIMQKENSIGKTFCLVDPSSPTLRTFIDEIGDLTERNFYRIPIDKLNKIPLFEPMIMVEWMSFLTNLMKRSSLPMRFLFNRGDYDTTNTREALRESSISCPPFETYIERLYRYFITRYA